MNIIKTIMSHNLKTIFSLIVLIFMFSELFYIDQFKSRVMKWTEVYLCME